MKIERIPYSQINILEEIARGGYGIVYKAIWNAKKVAIKKFFRHKYFLDELESHYKCCGCGCINRCYGFVEDPKTNDCMLVLQFAEGGDLHNRLRNKFSEITWKEKIEIFSQISIGLKSIHTRDFIHRDMHSGNVLLLYLEEPIIQCKTNKKWQIGDLGLTRPANMPENNIYGVIPYIAPEIFIRSSFSKNSDVYCMGMIMWELTTGCKPFANVEHDHTLIYKIIDGERPKITEDTPECYANLMKRCWNSDPEKRPSITDIRKTIDSWDSEKYIAQFNKSEIKRKELISSKRLGPKFSEENHPKAIYTSRLLSFDSISLSSLTNEQEYISKENEFDIL
ncbi:kinase-like domain-containing protein [Glomus cerebriforme]|uniref:Kinase-like domain-containing protein n=1 Tax=Glomus cerebriforme TaxID=658196 RepID=A0A397TD72_9GLOM|nr:kinase-like domain-containing protein [Glomus cerebriforme]